MTHRLTTNYAKNYCNRSPIVKVIVENVVTCFFGTRCTSERTPANQDSELVGLLDSFRDVNGRLLMMK